METGKRIEWIDVLKYICIIFVMYSHLETNTDVVQNFYSPFFLTAFFFTAGYVYRPKDTFRTFLYKKFRQLFIPWLVFSVFNILLSQFFSFNEHESLFSELKWNFLQIRDKGDGIWFVAALFIAFIPFYFFIKKYEDCLRAGKQKPTMIAIGIALILSVVSVLYTNLFPAELLPWKTTALPWHFEYVFQAMFYMALGYLFKKQFEHIFDRYNQLRNRIIVVAVYVMLRYLPYVRNIDFGIGMSIAYTYVCQLIGVAMVVAVSKGIKTNRYVSYVGQNTIIYFALHGKVYSIVQTMLKRFAGGFYSIVLANTAASSVFAGIFAIGLSVVLMIPAYIINRWLPFIIGREKSIAPHQTATGI
jgi:fucose 4-O-acetylase-like acetyltransferase